MIQLRHFIILFAVVMTLPISTAFAQVLSTASSSATIVTPIALVKTVDMIFGNIAASNTAGSVILTPAGTRSITDGVTLPSNTGNVSAASFTVSGVIGYTYSIVLPTAPIALTRVSGSETMTVDNWISDPASTGVLTDGSAFLNIGATLYVSGSQMPGVYTSSTPFTITVNYN